MSQFSIIDKVDLFKQTNELICSDLINTSVSKEKLQRDFIILENKLRTKQVEKKALQIKRAELEKNIIEVNKEVGNKKILFLLEEKDVEIQNLKKRLKMPHEAHVQIVELKIVLREKQVLEDELHNTKEVVGTIKDQKEMMGNQVNIF